MAPLGPLLVPGFVLGIIDILIGDFGTGLVGVGAVAERLAFLREVGVTNNRFEASRFIFINFYRQSPNIYRKKHGDFMLAQCGKVT